MEPFQNPERGTNEAPRLRFRKSLAIAQSHRKTQGRFYYLQYGVIILVALGGFGILALRTSRPTPLPVDLFLWTGVGLLAGFVRYLFREQRHTADHFATLQVREIRIQLHGEQVELEEERSERGIYRDPSRDFESGEQLTALILGPEFDTSEPQEEPEPNMQPALPFQAPAKKLDLNGEPMEPRRRGA